MSIIFYCYVGWPIVGLALGSWLIFTKEFDDSAERMSIYAGRRAYAFFTVVVCVLLWPVVLVYIFKKDEEESG